MKRQGRRTLFALSGLAAIIGMTSLTATVSFAADAIKSETELSTKDIGSKENTFGSLVADALKEETKADAAFIAASAFASDYKLAKGDVSTADILKSLEYTGDSLVIVKLTGAQINKAIEHGLFLYPKSNPGFLHTSGLTINIDGGAERDKRVTSVKIGGAAVDSSKVYKIAMPAPLANGALAYFKVWKKEDIDRKSEKELDGKTLETAVKDFLKNKKKIDKGDERLIVKEK